MTRRVYCGRVGVGLELAYGERCPECGSRTHVTIPDEQCGAFVRCPHEPAHGHPCVLLPGHDDTHLAGDCKGRLKP